MDNFTIQAFEGICSWWLVWLSSQINEQNSQLLWYTIRSGFIPYSIEIPEINSLAAFKSELFNQVVN